MEDLPPGFRFFPTEEELVGFYLRKKLEGKTSSMDRVIPVIDINGVEPWNLPTLAGEMCRGDTEQWFFFWQGQEREARGGRPNRTTACGYWKATGSPGYVYSSDNRVIGVKKTMVFYKGRAPSGRKTKWKMNEYRAIHVSHQSPTAIPQLRREFSLCRIYVTSGCFRAFDRRPLENPRAEPQRQHEIDDQNRVDASFANSSETTHIGAYNLQEAGGSSGTNWNLNYNDNENGNSSNNDGVQFQEPSWEWGQINWL